MVKTGGAAMVGSVCKLNSHHTQPHFFKTASTKTVTFESYELRNILYFEHNKTKKPYISL